MQARFRKGATTRAIRWRATASARSLTLVKHGRVVVDVGERDVDRGGAGQTSHLPPHVLGLDDHGVVLSGLPVHVCQRHPYDACGKGQRSGVAFGVK